LITILDSNHPSSLCHYYFTIKNMKREIWSVGPTDDNRLDSLYIAAEIVKQYAGTDLKSGNMDYVLEKVYEKLEELRKKEK